MNDNKYPSNWRELPAFPAVPATEPRNVYQLDDAGAPYNTIFCSEANAEAMWPGGQGRQWSLDPLWCPWGTWDGVTLVAPEQAA
jgi:hypothetical protein